MLSEFELRNCRGLKVINCTWNVGFLCLVDLNCVTVEVNLQLPHSSELWKKQNGIFSSFQIVWDPKLNRYVGEGVEEEPVPEPPPSVAASSEKLNGSVHGSFGGLTAARLSGGSRYFNPLIETAQCKPQSMPVAAPPVPVPANFGFIPAMP
ncbi:unnamed protein product, partial [Gongylonema pulchrum]|uniref:Chorein_N domain-containing protein n=1 Tax=Gongylonema pulchrum TaxID=637853 RepID=A0A183ET68_9BILA